MMGIKEEPVVDIVLPDYKNSILSLTGSLMQAIGLPAPHGSLPDLDAAMSRPHRNRILLILDGMGFEFLKQALPPESFLRRHLVREISSVYPCTTAAAMTTFQSGLSPLEHGWLGWSTYFKEYGRTVDLFIDRDSLSGGTITPSPAATFLTFEDITRKILQHKNTDVTCRRILPPFAENGVHSIGQMIDKIREYCETGSGQLIIAYWYEPDMMMHAEGPGSARVTAEIAAYDALIESLFQSLDDALLIVTADHGQVEIEEDVLLNEMDSLNDCLIMPPSIESRAASLFVKHSRIMDFKTAFNGLLGDRFWLMSREEAFDRQLFGPGKPHRKVDDFVGDFLACATGHALLRYQSSFNRPLTMFKGHHAGLCREEMLVPLIIAEK